MYEKEPLLFSTWLEETKALQEKSFGHELPKALDGDLVGYVVTNVLAATDELHEALNEVSWKPWAAAEFVNREAFIGELVDTLHFVGNLLVGVGCTDEELNSAYLEKMERNRLRQQVGYTGLEKCSDCKRALDDIQLHGGGWTEEIDEDGKAVKFTCEDCRSIDAGL